MYLHLHFFVGGGDTPCNAQALFLTLYSGITPGITQGTIWDAVDHTLGSCVQGKCLTHCTICLAPGGFGFGVSGSFCLGLLWGPHPAVLRAQT